MTLLRLDNVHTYYGNIHALKGVSITVDEGEIVTLIGANGAGKSTTLKTISGLLFPRRGKVYLGDEVLTKYPAHAIVKKGVIHVPEGRRVFSRLTVMENLEMGAFTRKDKFGIQQNLRRVFELFPRLQERQSQVAGTLSGGEQQMLAMGRALMSNPRILLLDEPSMGLAPVLVDLIFDTIKELNKQGMTILLVEQNALLALDIANRGYVLETGRIALSGDAKELAQNPQVKEVYLGGA